MLDQSVLYVPDELLNGLDSLLGRRQLGTPTWRVVCRHATAHKAADTGGGQQQQEREDRHSASDAHCSLVQHQQHTGVQGEGPSPRSPEEPQPQVEELLLLLPLLLLLSLVAEEQLRCGLLPSGGLLLLSLGRPRPLQVRAMRGTR